MDRASGHATCDVLTRQVYRLAMIARVVGFGQSPVNCQEIYGL